MNSSDTESDVIYEMIPRGRYIKVSAIDVRTGEEVSIVGDVRRPEKMLQQLALRKLRKQQASS